MKKRIALVAAIATAIAVGGMVPASAKLGAPVVAGDSCGKAAGTLEVKAKEGDIYVYVTSGGALGIKASKGGSDLCAAPSYSGLTSVILKATAGDSSGGDITFELEGYNADTIANFGSAVFSVQADDTLFFDASGLSGADADFKAINGLVTEDTFTLGSLTGAYYAGMLKFVGGKADDTFDASAVTTTPVWADGGDGNDTLSGGALADDLAGGDGSDDGDDVLYGNAGNDDITVADGSETCDKAHPSGDPGRCAGKTYSTTGADQGWGGLGNDEIEADGADIVAPGDGADVVTGSKLFQLNYGDSTAGISINLTTTPKKVLSTAGNDYFEATTVYEFVGSGLADTFVGTAAGDETFYGLAGGDKFFGLGGEDFFSAGGGDDVAKAGAGVDEVYGGGGNDLISAGLGDDIVYGGSGDDIMYGGPGNDMLRGMEGKDQGWGGRGAGDLCAAEVTDSCEYKK